MSSRGNRRPSAEGSPSTVVIRPTRSLFNLDLAALWDYRELLGFLIWRDVKVRYKQTVIGATWVILQPLLTMAILTVIFGHFAKMPSDGLPYPLFALAALLPWTYVSQAVSWGGASLVRNSHLISKVYFPRLIIPVASVATPLVDLGLSFAALLGLMGWYGIPPTWRVLALPPFLLLALVTAMAASLCLSALNVRYRDVGYAIPFVVQFWMYASPVAYPVSLVPDHWRLLYGLNPMASVIQGFRWALVGGESPDMRVMAASTGMVVALLMIGVVNFRHMERTFADVV
jgi:lipopolysaccharide transport system permease protein